MSVQQNSLDALNAQLQNTYNAAVANFKSQLGQYDTNYINAVLNHFPAPTAPVVPQLTQYAYDANLVPQPTVTTDPALTALLAPPTIPTPAPTPTAPFGGIGAAATATDNDTLIFRATVEGALNRIIVKLGA